MRKVILITLTGVVFFAVAMYFRLGMYKEVTLEQREVGPLKLLYVQHTGPYYKIAEKIERVETWAKAHGIACPRTFGEYLDDPKSVDEDRLQSIGGCVLETLPQKEVLLAEFKTAERASRLYLVANFSGAPSVGPYAVYPKALDWITKNNFALDGPIIEIYKVLNEKEVLTEYLFPIH